MKLICFVILVFLLVPAGKAQELYGKFLDHEQGLLSNECYDINYDDKGYLIVGTIYGPMKFDGEVFIPICTNLPMERRIMYDFEKDPQGNVYLFNSRNEIFKLQNDKAIWIGPKNGSEFQNATIKYVNRFTKLYFTKNSLYISSYDDYLKYSFKTKKVTHYYPFRDDLCRFTYNSKASFPFEKRMSSKEPSGSKVQIEFPESKQVFTYDNSIAYDSREDQLTVGNTTYLLMCMKLFRKTGNHVVPLDYSKILFFEYFHDRLWLCTLEGLIELDRNGKFIHHHFKGEIIGGVAPLKSGGIAVSLNRKGVFISSNIHDRIHYGITATSTATIHGINLVGSSRSELFKYENYKMENLVPSDLFSANLKRSYQDGIFRILSYKNQLLLCSGLGVSVYDQDFKKTQDIRDIRNGLFEVFTDQEHIYNISRAHVLKISWKNLLTTSHPFHPVKIPIEHVKCYTRLNDSIILIGTRNGLFKYHLKTDKISQIKLPGQHNGISSIHTIGNNELLVSTLYQGIFRMTGDKVTGKLTAPCISVSKTLFLKGKLIIQGNDGIYIRNLNKSGNPVWIKFFSGETRNIFILENSLLISYNEDLIIKQLSGYQKIYKPKIVLNKIQLGDREWNNFPAVIPSNTSISVDVDILQFDANKIYLYYKLKGENTISQQVEGTKINFDALKSGRYQLEIYPVIDGKIQFNNRKTFRFTMEETFWESTIFYIGTAILVIFVIFSIFLLMNLRRKKRSAERSKLESKLNEYKLLAVKAQVNPHFLSNGLSAIQALILKEDNDLAAQYLAKFSYLMRKILLYSEQQFISISDELQLVDAYLELELLRFRHKFSVQKTIHLKSDELTQFIIPSLLLQPILENAIWHGLRDQENNPTLHILFEINEKRELVIEIRDNGYGFKEKKPSEKHFSKGNQLIHERITTLNKQFETPVAFLEILSSENGTTVRFVFSPKLYNIPI
ncbi:Sensor histidine kinase YehU [compost metagenome]